MFVTRFAPSPTGHLHRGHAFSALTAHETARRQGGRFILRIEDIDRTRCRPEFEAGIYEDLAWLGLSWETPVRRQSDHMDDYHRALQSLIDRGLAYRCFRTRREIAEAMASAPHGPQPVWISEPLSMAEETERLNRGEAFAWRLSLAAAAESLGGLDHLTLLERGIAYPAHPDLAGDIVLARKDVGVAYHLAVVVDDALQGVTQVIRGEDLKEATHIQRLLQALLDLPAPDYSHHRLLTDADGRRFAKRDRAETLADLRDRGISAETLRREMGFD